MSQGLPITRRAEGRGFTVLELAIALALISLVALLAIPAFYSRPEVTLERAARLLVRDLQLAQHEAIAQGQDVHFVFLADGAGYVPRFSDGTALSNPAGKGSLERVYERDAVFQGVRISRLELEEHPSTIRFDRLGFAYGTGSIELYFNGQDCRIEVQESSGFVTLRGLAGPDS